MKELSVAIIGAGQIGRMHAENIVHHVPNMKLEAVVEKELSFAWSQTMNIPLYTNSYDEVLQSKHIDAVIICTPSSTHLGMIEQAIDHGKHIFCEKPIAFDPQQIARLKDKLTKNKLQLQVGYNRRFDPDFLSLKQEMTQGIIGEPHIIRITNRDPKRDNNKPMSQTGGMFMDINVHDFDMVRFITQREIKSVYATGEVLIEQELREVGDIDTAVITLQMDGGFLCVIDSSRETNYGYDQRVEVFGSKGSVQVNNPQKSNQVLFNKQGIQSLGLHDGYQGRYQEAYVNQLRSFAEAVIQRKQTIVSTDDAMHAVAAAVAAQISYQERRIVSLDEIYEQHHLLQEELLLEVV